MHAAATAKQPKSTTFNPATTITSATYNHYLKLATKQKQSKTIKHYAHNVNN